MQSASPLLHTVYALMLTLLAGAARGELALDASVFRLESDQHGETLMGSAVLVAPGVLLTNCHVVAASGAIRVFNARGEQWSAERDVGDAYRDLCVLRAPAVRGVPAERTRSESTMTGLPVHAAGYSDGTFRVEVGHIRGLHTCACDGGKVIQTTTPFEPGASGGGLFDSDGRLIGILTFKNRLGGAYHFAVPIAWYRFVDSATIDTQDTRQPFWKSGRDSAFFLSACALGAERDWKSLRVLAHRWHLSEPDNPEPLVALGKAEAGVGDRRSAREAFKAALRLDSTHAEAAWELQKLDLDSSPFE